ncbi:FecCD family ABC transporter permease [Propionibacterium sp.]|uniref:FecCD family ABC transporter permease n=1 Tax=Propionibacterium sp. TaxID=1977903 RepID=UPI0039EC1245
MSKITAAPRTSVASSTQGRESRTPRFMLVALLIVFILLFIVSFSLGRFIVPPSTVIDMLWSTATGHPTPNSVTKTVLLEVRLPRIVAASLIGAALATAGATFQGLFRNPMVSPDILGATSGAGFGAALGILMSFSLLGVSTLAFAIGVCAVLLSYSISLVISRGDDAVLMLVLTGMAVYNLFLAFISLIKYVADPDNKLPAITFWLMGGLASITLKNLAMIVPPLVIGWIPILALRWRLNVLSFGEEEAQALGVNTQRLRWIFIICATLLTAASVAVSGIIAWVGLVIPHVARRFVGPNFSYLIPASMLCGASFLLIADDVARTVTAQEIPLGILTSLIGGPFFILLLIRGRKGTR